MKWSEVVQYAKEHGATIADNEKIVFGDEKNLIVIYSLSENDEFMLVNIIPDSKYSMSYPCSYIENLMISTHNIDKNNIQNINYGVDPKCFIDLPNLDWGMFRDWAVAIGAKLDDNNTIIYEVKYDDITTRKYLFDRNGEIWLDSGGIFHENITKYRTPTQMRDILKGLLERCSN